MLTDEHVTPLLGYGLAGLTLMSLGRGRKGASEALLPFFR
jgi:hypothetical protein